MCDVTNQYAAEKIGVPYPTQTEHFPISYYISLHQDSR